MMRSLEKEMQKKPQRIGVHVDNKMEIESINGVHVNQTNPKKEEMVLEYENGRKIEHNMN